MKCVVKTTTRPSRAARMMFHVALRLYGSIPVHCRKLFWSSISFDINQESSCRSSTALVCCKELEWHWPYLLQFWMLHLHFLHLQLKHHHEVRLKSYNYITIYYIPIYIYLYSPNFSHIHPYVAQFQDAWSRLIQEDHRRSPNQRQAKRKLSLLATGQSSYRNAPTREDSRSHTVIRREHRHHNCRTCPARVCAFSVKPTCCIISLQRLVTCRFEHHDAFDAFACNLDCKQCEHLQNSSKQFRNHPLVFRIYVIRYMDVTFLC